MSCDWGKVEKSFDVQDEVRREYASVLTVDTLNMLCSEVQGWIQTDDPDFLDAAVILLHKEKVAIRGVLLDEISNLAEARLNRNIRVGTGERKKWMRNNLEGMRSLYANYNYDISNQLAFTLIEVCGLNTEETYRFVSKIIERDHTKNFEKLKDMFDISMEPSPSGRSVKRYYEKFKKTSKFTEKMLHKNFFVSRWYPNMTPEDIKNHLIQDLKDHEAPVEALDAKKMT
ncbi:hypothetical protein M3908_003559 [Vibrio metschnikovii]|nr:hypothetical protein [Vibrio metschnikovii]EKO3657048.1 hypothetical protein [Vibrio metschnikovii]